eukprot:TRINITY_DN587_c0_g1_i2.p2 TRINITY_DN587_c0_g1~~TRINITY_DN587_c0_g1_i2.p2  ORF type:complete len:176 (+),score=66.24 TRINITY_DN587_c0_g1_i2:30-530(+)
MSSTIDQDVDDFSQYVLRNTTANPSTDDNAQEQQEEFSGSSSSSTSTSTSTTQQQEQQQEQPNITTTTTIIDPVINRIALPMSSSPLSKNSKDISYRSDTQSQNTSGVTVNRGKYIDSSIPISIVPTDLHVINKTAGPPPDGKNANNNVVTVFDGMCLSNFLPVCI